MFILEESQLLEDTIKDTTVLELYKVLRRFESSNDRYPLVETILANEKCQGLTRLALKFYESNGFDIRQAISENCKFTSNQREEICKTLDLELNDVAALALVVSATLNQLFVIDNFVGPTNENALTSSYGNLPQDLQVLQQDINYLSLTRDGSEVYHKVVNPWILKLVQLYWNLLNSLGCSRRLLELEFLVWKHRYLTVHLMILLEPAETLMNDLRKIQEYIFDHHIINSDSKENNTQLTRFNVVELCCELVQSALLRDGITSCRKIFDYASETSGVSIEHTGVLGKRTKFQQKDIPQLVVKVIRNPEASQADNQFDLEGISVLPKDIKLDDDTLLPDIEFVTESDNSCPEVVKESLNAEMQILMLTKLDFILKTEVMEESLKDEWTLAYLRSIVMSASLWSLKYKAMALRSVVEKKHMRKVDRALLQMEELIKSVEIGDNTLKRMQSFYSILPLSKWQMQRSLGDISFDISLHKNALELYLSIEYWEGLIKCYCALGQTVKAEKIILQELDKQATPYLYCLLGDVTDDTEYYEKSWALSKGRFARAKKSVGTYHYVRKEYAAAIENYELALKVSPSNMSILSLLAYSCLITERYERAAECYRSITHLDDNNFLAWNNLSKAYIKLNQKERAWRTLREAIKCNYEEWKIWENFMIVSIELGALDDVITAWHRIIDIKSSHKDDQVLSALTYALVRRPSEKADSEYMKLLNDALKLVARLNSTSDCSSRLWICYYKLLIKEFQLYKAKFMQDSDGQQSVKFEIDSRISKITNALQRATPTSLVADHDWLNVPEKIDRVLDSYTELADCYLAAIEILGLRPELNRQWKSFKLSANNTLTTLVKKGYNLEGSKTQHDL